MSVPRIVQIIPIGPVHREVLLTAGATTRRIFGVEAAIMPAIPVPLRALNEGRKQLDADEVLDVLFDKLSLDVSRVIGVTHFDLFAEGRNFVFGYAHMRDRIAVFSTWRLLNDRQRVE